MTADFKQSQTKENLMRAFAGESQARSRYTIAAAQAKKEGLYVIETLFSFTANQEMEHANIFYHYLRELSGENIHIDAGYPVDISDHISLLLRSAQHNEYEEHDDIYLNFSRIAREEGFPQIAGSFAMIADIEKTHGDRFGYFSRLLEADKCFTSEAETAWMCLKCGHIYHGKKAPKECPVCHHARGYFVCREMDPHIIL